MVRRILPSFYVDPADLHASNIEVAVQLGLARIFASARAFGQDIEPNELDIQQARSFQLIGEPVPAEDTDCYCVIVEASDDLMTALAAALETVE